MDISLSPDNEKFLRSQIAAGIYGSINEAINAAINSVISETFISKKIIDDFNNEIEKGWIAAEKGDVLDGQTVMDELKKKYAN